MTKAPSKVARNNQLLLEAIFFLFKIAPKITVYLRELFYFRHDTPGISSGK